MSPSLARYVPVVYADGIVVFRFDQTPEKRTIASNVQPDAVAHRDVLTTNGSLKHLPTVSWHDFSLPITNSMNLTTVLMDSVVVTVIQYRASCPYSIKRKVNWVYIIFAHSLLAATSNIYWRYALSRCCADKNSRFHTFFAHLFNPVLFLFWWHLYITL